MSRSPLPEFFGSTRFISWNIDGRQVQIQPFIVFLMSATCIYRIWVSQSNKLNVLPGIGYLTTRDLEKFQKIKVKYFKDIFLEKKKDHFNYTVMTYVFVTRWARKNESSPCLKSDVMFKGKASFKACLFGRIQVSILDLGCFAFVTTEWMNYLQMNSSAILARNEENMRASYFKRKTASQEDFWDPCQKNSKEN